LTRRAVTKELGPGGVQQYLKDQVIKHGGMYDHFTSPGKKGVPDLIITWPEFGWARIHFIETKTIGGKVKPWQEKDHKARRAMGAQVFVLWSKAAVDTYLQQYAPMTYNGERIYFDGDRRQ
jgi:hypothetical protein